MVRLKENTSECALFPYYFQFHYGTIKRSVLPLRLPHRLSFNSTMVRLKEDISIISDDINYFQFHYGTIKSLTLEKISALIFKNLADTKL